MGSPTRLRRHDAPTLSNIMHGSHMRSLVRLGDTPVVLIMPLNFFRVSQPRDGGDARVVTR